MLMGFTEAGWRLVCKDSPKEGLPSQASQPIIDHWSVWERGLSLSAPPVNLCLCTATLSEKQDECLLLEMLI